jgi:hypothetical protein
MDLDDDGEEGCLRLRDRFASCIIATLRLALVVCCDWQLPRKHISWQSFYSYQGWLALARES